MWQLIQDNFISNYHEYLGDLHHMLVALSKIQTFVFSWTPLMYICVKIEELLSVVPSYESSYGRLLAWTVAAARLLEAIIFILVR